MKRLGLMLAVVALLCFSACAPHAQGKYEFDPGETLTPEMLESIFADESEADTTPAETQMEVNGETTIYFTASGTKYHLFLDCQSLSRSTNISESTLGNYSEHKKNDCCKYCAKRANISDTPAETT